MDLISQTGKKKKKKKWLPHNGFLLFFEKFKEN